jgi:Fe-S cluster assembly protein SufD
MTTQNTLEPSAQHGLVAHSHGYVPGEADVPIQTRSERVRSYKVADFGPISRREEQWKYTTSEQIRGLDEDALTEYLGDLDLKSPEGVITSWVGPEHPAFGFAGIPEDRPSAAAWESAEQAYLITLPAGGMRRRRGADYT